MRKCKEGFASPIFIKHPLCPIMDYDPKNYKDTFLEVLSILDVIVKSRDQTAKKKDPDARRANPEE